MARLIIHNPSFSRKEIDDLRLKRTLELSPLERIKMAFNLMEFSLRFKKDSFKQINEGAIILKKHS